MRTFQLVACLLAAIVPGRSALVAQAPTTPAPRSSEPAATVDDGRKLYAAYGCYQCHGYEGQGSSATGPRIGPRPLPLASFSKYVRRPTGQMPPYSTTVVSDSDLANIRAFLDARAAPPAVDSIPQLK